jgi:alkylation response protein AidB-like acyl-CoA dehydrogenase
MATTVRPAELPTLDAVARKASERADLEAGMAKPFATGIAGGSRSRRCASHGGYGYSREHPIEAPVPRRAPADDRRGLERDRPRVIARRLLERHAI